VIRRTKVGAVTVGFLGGLVFGALVWSTQIQRSRRELFSRNPMKRLAALGYLGGGTGLDTVHILSDYVRWERHPALRRRGERILRRMKRHLD
jgi:hypothetical protein